LLLDLSTAGWRQLAAAAHAHQLAPLLHWQLRRLLPAGAPTPVAESLRQAYMSSALAAMLRERTLRAVLGALNGTGVVPALSKGVALAYFVYPEPACRPMGDIDLWVSTAEMPAAQAALADLGYVQRLKASRPVALQADRDGEIQMVGQQRGEGLVELHYGVFAGEWLQRATQIDRAGVRSRWQAHALLGSDIHLLAPEDAFIQIAVHLSVNHQLSLHVLRSLLDLALLARQGLDCDLVIDRARAWGLGVVMGLVLELLTTLFPVPEVAPAAAALRLGSTRRRLLGHFTSAGQVLAGEKLFHSRRRLLFQLALVDRPEVVAALLARSVWPEQQWLAARYGRAGLGVRLRHAGAVVRGKV
jgi:hypothetical protein